MVGGSWEYHGMNVGGSMEDHKGLSRPKIAIIVNLFYLGGFKGNDVIPSGFSQC